ncbi:MAG: glycosyltransferase family 2 protein [Burkholderiales bacterium]|nr:MAG: glycosyltransferase family 2 protein [Burkholderiales bacterium]
MSGEGTAVVPAVSVCVITYNQAPYIRQCLESLVAQQVEGGLEVIVGDDCSTDGTREIVREIAAAHPDVVRPILHETNIGAGVHNYLAVHAAARGRYVAHVDGDDYALPGKLARQQAFLDAHPEVTVVWHAMRVERADGGTLTTGDMQAAFPGGVVDLRRALRAGEAGGLHSSMMYRRAVPVTAWPAFPVLDTFRVFELLAHGPGRALPEELGAYRVHGQSLSQRGNARMKSLAADHAEHLLHRRPELRPDVFVYAVSNAAIDLLSRRSTLGRFLRLAWRTACWVPPSIWLAQLRTLRAVQFRDRA